MIRFGLQLVAGALATAIPGLSLAADDACTSATPAVMGGPIVTDKNKISLRWLSTSNYELTYDGKIYLLDTYYDQGPRNRPTGVVPDQVKAADAIFIGHAHFDHISDIGVVARRTKAMVYGAPLTIETAEKLGVPPNQTKVLASGEAVTFPTVKVDAALAQHSTLSQEVLGTLGHLYDLDAGSAKPEEAAAEKAIMAKGTFAPDVITKGTYAYAFTFDGGFKLLWIDSAGPITDGDRALAQKLGPVDIAIIAYQGHPVSQIQIPVTLDLVKLFKPRLYLPAHHDQIFGTFVDLGVERLFEAVQAALPGTQTMMVLHDKPMCFDITKH